MKKTILILRIVTVVSPTSQVLAFYIFVSAALSSRLFSIMISSSNDGYMLELLKLVACGIVGCLDWSSAIADGYEWQYSPPGCPPPLAFNCSSVNVIIKISCCERSLLSRPFVAVLDLAHLPGDIQTSFSVLGHSSSRFRVSRRVIAVGDSE